MDTTIHVFLSYVRVEKGLAHNTILAYGRDLKRFAAFLAKRHKQRVEEVNREDVVDFLSSLYQEKLDSRSVARYLVSLRCLFKFAMMEELVTIDPTENLESPKIRQSLPTYLRVDEVDKVLAAPDLSTPDRLAGPGHAGSALFLRLARFRIAESAYFRRGYANRLRALHWKGR